MWLRVVITFQAKNLWTSLSFKWSMSAHRNPGSRYAVYLRDFLNEHMLNPFSLLPVWKRWGTFPATCSHYHDDLSAQTQGAKPSQTKHLKPWTKMNFSSPYFCFSLVITIRKIKQIKTFNPTKNKWTLVSILAKECSSRHPLQTCSICNYLRNENLSHHNHVICQEGKNSFSSYLSKHLLSCQPH